MADAPEISESKPSGSDQDGSALPPPGLPEVPGGWELRPFTFAGATSVELWIPRAPDDLLDDEAVQERNSFNDSMPYWAWLWDSAPTMADLLCARDWPAGARVLEIGGGLGLVGVALGAAWVDLALTMTDHDPLALDAMSANAAWNGVDADVRAFDWRDPSTLQAEGFDVVLGCDVTYEGQAHEPLLGALRHALARDGRAYLADPGRTRLPQLLRRAQAAGFTATLTDSRGEAASPEVGDFRLVELRRI